jgi:hypothetical protein
MMTENRTIACLGDEQLLFGSLKVKCMDPTEDCEE